MAKYEVKDGVGIIPAGSITIEDEAFKGCEELKSVVIPDSVTKIGSHAFRWCTALTEVIIPDSVTIIDSVAFAGCFSLKNLVIPDSVTEIGRAAFQACSNLTDIVISESVIRIAPGAFSSIRDLKSITVAAGNKVYDSRDNCNAIIETSTNTLIAGCRNTVIPSSVTRIGSDAFLGCYGLADFVIPESVTEIGEAAFHGARLTSVVISRGVKEIGEWAFRECPTLTDVVIGDHVEQIDDYAFFKCPNLTHLVIGNSVAKIGESAFSECSSLKSVIIPESVKEVHDHAFSGCTSLTDIRLANWETGSWVFCGCTALKNITFHESVTKIAPAAFQECTSLTEVMIPDTVTLIGGGAFKFTGLTHIVIPNQVEEIGSEAFLNCTSLNDVIIPNSVTKIGSEAFMNCTNLSDVVISDSVTEIGRCAFLGCTSLKSVVIPGSVTEIERYTFKGCTSLQTITLPESVTYIELYSFAFEDCTALKTIYVPANKYGHFKKLLPKDLHALIVKQPVPKKPKKSGIAVNTDNLPEEGKIILKVLSITHKVMTQLRAEKKATGDYSKSVTIEEDGYKFLFTVRKYWDDSYPPISVNLRFLVGVYRGNDRLMGCEVSHSKNNTDLQNSDGKYIVYAWLCDTSQVSPLFQSGDTICIDNKGKVAYAKAEILSEKTELNDLSISHITKKLRLTKELGHAETLAYETGYPPQIITYVADDSSEEYFEGKDVVEKDLIVCLTSERHESMGLCWYEYSSETVSTDSAVQLATPLTEQEITLQHKQKALDELLEDCQGEFCYGDKRVERYRNSYLILGEENIDAIYKTYMKWLNENCTTFAQDAYSGEFTGIAIDWQGKEDQQPVFDVSGDKMQLR